MVSSYRVECQREGRGRGYQARSMLRANGANSLAVKSCICWRNWKPRQRAYKPIEPRNKLS